MVAGYHPAAATAWSWLQHCDQLEQDPDFRNKFVSSMVGSHPGVRAALAGGGPASEINYLSWNATDASKLVRTLTFLSHPLEKTSMATNTAYANCCRRRRRSSERSPASWCRDCAGGASESQSFTTKPSNSWRGKVLLLVDFSVHHAFYLYVLSVGA
jgi:hypothetical protein